METDRSRVFWNIGKPNSASHTVILVCLVATLSYLAPKLAGALLLQPGTVWPLWPGCALLISVLLLVPQRIWPMVIPAAFAAFVFYDLQAGVPIGSIAWFIAADTVQVLTAAFCLRYFFDGVPRLNSVKALSKYLFFAVLLAPFAAAFLSAFGIHGDYWTSWRISFLSEVLAFVTLTPAILGWVSYGPAWVRKPRAYLFEFAALISGLVLLSYITFTAPESGSSPAMLYSLVPFLLWAALRFGPVGVSTAAIVVAFLSIWGAIHGRGPFTNGEQLNRLLSLQLFLVFTATPFMVLAALVEERKQADDELREGEERLRLAMEAGKLGGWEWDVKSERNPWFGGAHLLFGITSADRFGFVQDFWDRVHPEHHGQLRKAIEIAKQSHEEFDEEFRVVWPDGTLHWLRSLGRFFYAPDGKPERMLGISGDITERKQVEQVLRQSEAELMEAQRLANVGSWRWDPRTDTVTWSEELYRIVGLDPGLPAVSYKEHSKLYTAESWDRFRCAVEEAFRTGTPYELDLEMIRFDGARRWLIAKGEVRRDSTGHIVQLRGTVQDITERKRTEEALRESEARERAKVKELETLLDAAPITILIATDPKCKSITANRTGCQLYHVPIGTNVSTSVSAVGPPPPFRIMRDGIEIPADELPLQRAAATGIPVIGTFTTLVLRDATEHHMIGNTAPLFDEDGKPRGAVGAFVDITELKLAEEALSKLSRRLIEAQEQERARIARELHDDLSQRMALLQIGLAQFDQDTVGFSSKARQQLHDIAELCREVSSGIHDLSHQLHPFKLDTLGLVASLKGLCREFSNQHNLQVQFVHNDIPGRIPKEVTLCLFRIVQEALRNVVKHSGAAEAKVELSGHGDRIDVRISDSGAGFSPESAKGIGGLGLISMRERLRLVAGHLSVESQPARGTMIHARVPLSSGSVSTRAAG